MILDKTAIDLIRKSGLGIKVKKSVPTYFTIAGEEDVKTGLVSPGLDMSPTPGFINTLEGPVSFEVGDIICKGWTKGELWPMSPEKFSQYKLEITAPTETDWGTCENKNFVHVVKMPIEFTLDLEGGKPVTAKAGDYLIFDDNSAWPLAEELLALSYKLA